MLTTGADAAPVSPAEEPLSCQPVADNCSDCGKPLGESGHIHTCSPSRETTQREEWAVEIRWPHDGWVSITPVPENEAAARERYAWWLEREHASVVRLIHVVTTRTVVEGPADA